MKEFIFRLSTYFILIALIMSCEPHLSNYQLTISDSKNVADKKAQLWAKTENLFLQKIEKYANRMDSFYTHFLLYEDSGLKDMVANVVYLDDQLIGVNLIFDRKDDFDPDKFEEFKASYGAYMRNESDYTYTSVGNYTVFEGDDDNGNLWYHTFLIAEYKHVKNFGFSTWMVSIPASQTQHMDYVINVLFEGNYSKRIKPWIDFSPT